VVEILSYLNFVYIGTFAAALDFFSDCKVKNVNEYWEILTDPIEKINTAWQHFGIPSSSSYSPVS